MMKKLKVLDEELLVASETLLLGLNVRLLVVDSLLLLLVVPVYGDRPSHVVFKHPLERLALATNKYVQE